MASRDTAAWKRYGVIALADRMDSRRRTRWSSEAWELLSSGRAYFAYYAKDGWFVSFYVLDPAGRKLYIAYVDP